MHIADLILKSMLETLSPDEQEQLNEWFRKEPGNRLLYNEIRHGQELAWRFDLWTKLESDQALKRTIRRIRQGTRKRLLQKTVRYAVVLIPVLLIPAFFLLKSVVFPEQQEQPVSTEILPGGWQAELLLANGTKIDLHGQREALAGADKSRILIDSNTVIYEPGKTEGRKTEIHTIKTPRGGTFLLVLPDGSQVHLNSLSTVEFPTRFEGKERKVKLTGQAYFSVQKNAEFPFVVETESGRIEVLGTEFDVKCYPEERLAQTTLCTGKVRISSQRDQPVVLAPGEQFVADRESGGFTVEKVDTKRFTSWIDDQFYFSENTLQEIFIELQRWYHFEVRFENPESRELLFSGKFSRSKNMETILEVMRSAGIVWVLEEHTLCIK